MGNEYSPVSHASTWSFVVWANGEIDFEARSAHDYCLLRKGKAKKCRQCRRPILVSNLEAGLCPDCDGRGDVLGFDQG